MDERVYRGLMRRLEVETLVGRQSSELLWKVVLGRVAFGWLWMSWMEYCSHLRGHDLRPDLYRGP